MKIRTIEELLPEDIERIDNNINNHRVELFKFLLIQFKRMGWGTKRSAKALRIKHDDFKKMMKGEIDQWNWGDALRFLSMIPCQLHLMIRPFFVEACRANALLPIHELQEKEKKEKIENVSS